MVRERSPRGRVAVDGVQVRSYILVQRESGGILIAVPDSAPPRLILCMRISISGRSEGKSKLYVCALPASLQLG
jgi:hypothetical protein